MNIGSDTFEKAIAASCIQLAQAYSVTERVPIEQAKIKVGQYLLSMDQFFPPKNESDNMLEAIQGEISQAIKKCSNAPDKAYYELLKLREKIV